MQINLSRSPIILLLASMLLILPSISRAGGLYLNEFGTPSMGVAGAGANAVASDASTSFHNAAGMTRIKGKELIITGGLLYSTIKFDPDADTPIPGGDGGDAHRPPDSLCHRGPVQVERAPFHRRLVCVCRLRQG